MWTLDQIAVTLVEADGATTLVRVATPVGLVEVIGEVHFDGDTMWITRAHIGGPGAGRVGRRGLNAIGAKLLVEANVRQVILEGSHRTTGRNPGRAPRPIRFPH